MALSVTQSRSEQSMNMETRHTHPVPVPRTSHSPLKSPCFSPISMYWCIHTHLPGLSFFLFFAYQLPVYPSRPSHFTNSHGGTITGKVLSAGLSELSISFGNKSYFLNFSENSVYMLREHSPTVLSKISGPKLPGSDPCSALS